MFILQVICCIGGAIVLAAGVEGFENWLNKRPIQEERSTPIYLTKRKETN